MQSSSICLLENNVHLYHYKFSAHANEFVLVEKRTYFNVFSNCLLHLHWYNVNVIKLSNQNGSSLYDCHFIFYWTFTTNGQRYSSFSESFHVRQLYHWRRRLKFDIIYKRLRKKTQPSSEYSAKITNHVIYTFTSCQLFLMIYSQQISFNRCRNSHNLLLYLSVSLLNRKCH